MDELVAEDYLDHKQRTGIDLKYAPADLLNAPSNPMRMHRLQGKRLQDEHIERALNEPRIFVRHATLP